jgi:hypothetical protein
MTDIPDDEQKILAEMPLHAITAVYGEQGLRARLAIETGRLDDAAGRQKISEALELAGRLHAADRRQREPYINHLLRVALRIICHYGVHDTDIICAALLHDAVEDHAGDLAATGGRPGALGVLADRFGPKAAALVEAVTNPVYLPGQDADEQYRAHVAASLAANPGARVIKVSDFTDNGVGVIHTTGAKAVRLASKYAPLVPVLAGLIARTDTPLAPHVKVRILGQLRTAQKRFAAIAPPAAAGPSALGLHSHARSPAVDIPVVTAARLTTDYPASCGRMTLRNRLVGRVSCGCVPRYGAKQLKGGAQCHRCTGSGTRRACS